MSIKDAYKPMASVTTKLSKEGCISLAKGGRLSQTTFILKEMWTILNLRNIFLQINGLYYQMRSIVELNTPLRGLE